MIVTFHLAVYIAYYVWENYIRSVYVTNSGNGSSANENPNIRDCPSNRDNANETRPDRTRITDENEPNLSNSGTENVINKGENSGQRQVREGEGDLPPHCCIRQILYCDEDSPNGNRQPRPSITEINANESNLSSSGTENVTNKVGASMQVAVGEEYNSCAKEILDVGRQFIYNVEPKFECNFESEEKGMKFIPPVYVQRYMIIESILKESYWAESIKKVVDFGCAELSFEMKHLKKLFGIQEIVSVDIDMDLLKYNSCKVSPTPTDYLQQRPTPLTVRVFCGSVAHTNEALVGTDAVIAIELIEHLFPGELECLPFTVFGFIKPKIAIFTTPNADFNVLFPNFKKFRHLDHKFEWSREQFEDWGNNLVKRYPEYKVEYRGVGPGPSGTERLGCCSQMATFVKVHEAQSLNEHEMHVQDGPYTLVQEYVFPYFQDKRTREEKLRDEAVNFITRCAMLSRVYDEETNKEVPLKNIMERINCFNRDKIKDVLIKDNWKIKTNADGHEVVVLPDSDNEDLESFPGSEDLDEYPQNYDATNFESTVTCEENWDCDENDLRDVSINNEAVGDSICVPLSDFKTPSVHSDCLDVAQTYKIEKNKHLVSSNDEKCSIGETIVPDVSVVFDKFNSIQRDSVPEKSPKTNLECSVYETPFSNGCKVLKSDCDVFNHSTQSSCSDHREIPKYCNKALNFESSDICEECDQDIPSDDSFCCACSVTSSFDTSTYATPCYSRLHRKYIPKCLSLQQLNAHYNSPSLSTEVGVTSKDQVMLISEHKDKFSKSMEGFKSQESCDMHDTCSNASRVLDSGYPDSYSEHNMDMDLTPEQFDDIETESEGNSSRSLSPPLPAPPQVPRLIDDVENGDVANNNRDGEGNNMVADMEEEPLEFEAQIEEVNNEIPNFDAADHPDQEFPQICHKHEYVHESITNPSTQSSEAIENLPWPLFDSKSKSVMTENKAMVQSFESTFSNLLGKKTVKSTKSDSSIATSSSWSHLESSDSQADFDGQDVNNHYSKLESCKLKTHNSLTTVLDGCSKFSNCSLVSPVLKNDTHNEVTEQDDSGYCVFPKWMLNMDDSLFEETGNIKKGDKNKSAPLQRDHVSSISVYESAESLDFSSVEFNVQSSFPAWLLAIELPDIDENDLESRDSQVSMWDFDDVDVLNYDVPTEDGGGDKPHQREAWF